MSLASPDQSPTLPPEISTSHLCLAAESTFSVGRSTRMVKKSLVENATFSLPGPGFVAICGASGSGKTLLLNTLAGLLPPADGLLRIDGENASAWRMKRRRRFWRERAAIIHQDHGIIPELSCEDNLTLGLSRKQYSKEELLHSLGEVGLDVPFDGPAAILSGGEQQRLAIARALPAARLMCSLTSRPPPSTPLTATKLSRSCGELRTGRTRSGRHARCRSYCCR